ncbi:PKD/REJ-like protein [Gracilaria domingensis]|nr:PKD/REJ-like protein [Gracilaria domingensis]
MEIIVILLVLLHLANGIPTGSQNSFLTLQRSPPDSLVDFLRVRQALPFGTASIGFVPPDFGRRDVLMINGTGDDSFTLSFVMERGSNVSDYEFKFLSNDTEILIPAEDHTASQIVSDTYVNITSLLDFRRFPGLVQLTVEARKSDGALVDSVEVHFLAAGMVLYLEESRTIVSGDGRSFNIEDFSQVYDKRIWDLGAFTQFLNGSNSNELSAGNDGISPYFSLEDIEPTLSDFEGQILWDSSTCSISGGQWNGSSLSLSQGCGMGFAWGLRNESSYDGHHFGFAFEENRAGNFTVAFRWPKFTEGSELDDELYMTYVDVLISGTPPAIVRRVEPGNPYSRDGGEELYVEMINSGDLDITSFNLNDVSFPIIPGSRQFITGPEDFYETARFLTRPGTGKRLPWTITATRLLENSSRTEPAAVIDESGFLFSYDDEEVLIISLSPDTFPETGAVEAVLSGNFSAFDPASAPNHKIIIGNYVVGSADIVSVTPTQIRLIIPPRAVVGSAWRYGVVVQVASSYSNRVFLSYYPLTMEISGHVYGASKDFETEDYLISTCGTTTFVIDVMNRPDYEVLIAWELVDPSGEPVQLSNNGTLLETDTHTLELPNSLVLDDGLYNLTATASEGEQSTSHTFHFRKSSSLIIGVEIVRPENRTIASPPVNLRIVAKIDIPPCVTDPKSLKYHWFYEDKLETIAKAKIDGVANPDIFNASLAPQFQSYVFSYENDTGTSAENITPTKLGRELIVPINELQYGLQRVRLVVSTPNASVFERSSTTQNASILGRASTAFYIQEPQLIAWIGDGEESKEVSDSEDLSMSGTRSYDPDILSTDASSLGLTYEWSCSYSLHSNKSQMTACGSELLPFTNRSSFNISKTVLQAKRNLSHDDFEGQVHLEYSLTVRKGSRQGTVVQLISVVNSEGLMLARHGEVEVTSSRGAVDHNAVEFWEDIVLRPLAPAGTQWRFRLEEPVWERSTFIAGNNRLIVGPGYYTSTGSSDPGYQSLPLGILAGKLSPHTIYKFSISFLEAGMMSNEVLVSFTTVEVPNLIFPPMVMNNGSTETVFTAHASASFQSNSSFTYQFYLISLDTSMREYCLDGCTGANCARFKVHRPGEYTLQCRLMAANGRTILAVQNNTRNLYISARSVEEDLAFYDNQTEKDYLWGDDGAVNERGFFVSHILHEQEAEVVALSEESARASDTCTKHVKKWANMSSTILRNELPNTPNTRNYVNIASNYARLRCTEDEETLYILLNMVDLSLARTPREEFLSTVASTEGEGIPMTALETDLIRFYNFSMTRALSGLASGSSRARLVAHSGEVSNIVLDLSELWVKHVTTSSTNGRLCGWDATFTSDTPDGESDRVLAPSSQRYPLGRSTIRVAVRCNPEQGKSLSTPFASFEWCDAIYDITQNERVLVTMAEMFDYPYLSGVQGRNRSETTRVVLVGISEEGDAHQLVSAVSDSQVAARTGESGSNDQTCYKIGMTMSSDSVARTDLCSENVPYRMWPRKELGDPLEAPFDKAAYQRRTSGIVATPETRNESRFVVAKSNSLGLYGAYKSACQDSSQSLHGSITRVSGMLIGVLLIALLVIFLTYSLVVLLVSVAARSNAFDGEAELYVDRDVYGRSVIPINTELQSSTSVSGTTMLTSAQGGSVRY